MGGNGLSCLAQAAPSVAGPPPSSVGVFPLSQVKRGLRGTAWTVFEGSVPEAMEVEILGVQRGARGPGRDLILARLRGAKPEYTGVVAGMSGSPVYIEGKLAGALSYRIGQFSKEPIAGITPIEQMLEVRDLPLGSSAGSNLQAGAARSGPRGFKDTNVDGMAFAAIETPLTMSGFEPEAIRVWKERLAGTGLEMVSAGGSGMGGAGLGGSSVADGWADNGPDDAPIVPGSAVSLELVRGDLEIAATCTVTYVDPKQLLACGHPVMQSGPVSLPMTATDVIATLASPLNAFKIVNTGRTIGAFTEDRDAAIRGEFGVKARMIPVLISLDANPAASQKAIERKIEVVDLPALTPSAVLVSVYQTLLESNASSARMSYHVSGEIRLAGEAPVPVESWGVPGEQMAAQLMAALGVADGFNRLYTNGSRHGPIEGVRLKVESLPGDLRVDVESVRLVSSSIVHPGDTVMVEATLRPWEQAARNVRVAFRLPDTLEPGSVRILVGSGAALDRTLEAAGATGRAPSEAAAVARLRGLHAADQLYVSLLLPNSQASVEGQTLAGLPLSMANSLGSPGNGIEAGLNGETLELAAQIGAGGVLNGQQLITLRVEAGGGLH